MNFNQAFKDIETSHILANTVFTWLGQHKGYYLLDTDMWYILIDKRKGKNGLCKGFRHTHTLQS